MPSVRVRGLAQGWPLTPVENWQAFINPGRNDSKLDQSRGGRETLTALRVPSGGALAAHLPPAAAPRSILPKRQGQTLATLSSWHPAVAQSFDPTEPSTVMIVISANSSMPSISP